MSENKERISKSLMYKEANNPREALEDARANAWIDYEYKDSQQLYHSCFEDGFNLGAQWAFDAIKRHIAYIAINKLHFPILQIYKFINLALGRRTNEKQKD